VFKYNGVIKHAKRQSNTKKSILYARITRVKFGVQIHSIAENPVVVYYEEKLNEC